MQPPPGDPPQFPPPPDQPSQGPPQQPPQWQPPPPPQGQPPQGQTPQGQPPQWQSPPQGQPPQGQHPSGPPQQAPQWQAPQYPPPGQNPQQGWSDQAPPPQYPGGPPGGYPQGGYPLPRPASPLPPIPPGPPLIRLSAIGDAWTLVKAQMGLWIGLIIIQWLVNSVAMAPFQIILQTMFPGVGARATPGQPPDFSTVGPALAVLYLVMIAVNVCVSAFLYGGMTRAALKQIRGYPIEITDLFSAKDVYPSLLVANLLIALSYVVGLALCIIPAFFIVGLLMLTFPLIVDKKMGATEAMSLSWNTLKGQAGMAAWFVIVLGLTIMLGYCACCIGLLFTWPLMFIAPCIVYRDFFMRDEVGIVPAEAPYPPPPIPDAMK